MSMDRKEDFFLDLRRGRIDLAKATYQTRARQIVVIARLDVGGPPHRNPDDEEVPSPHLHLYREGYGDKWASAPPPQHFRNMTNLWMTLDDFIRFCNIVEPTRVSPGPVHMISDISKLLDAYNSLAA